MPGSMLGIGTQGATFMEQETPTFSLCREVWGRSSVGQSFGLVEFEVCLKHPGAIPQADGVLSLQLGGLVSMRCGFLPPHTPCPRQIHTQPPTAHTLPHTYMHTHKRDKSQSYSSQNCSFLPELTCSRYTFTLPPEVVLTEATARSGWTGCQLRWEGEPTESGASSRWSKYRAMMNVRPSQS